MDDKKRFALGILVGRFQVLHLGHQDMIRTALALCDEVSVFIGSSQESGTEKNPCTYETREKMLKTVFGDRIQVYPLPDIGVGNNSAWGEYVLKNVRICCGRLPDLLISGKEERRTSWFDGMEGVSIAELYIPKTIEISASEMREMMLENRKEEWQCYSPEALHPLYETLRSEVLSAQGHAKTMSI